MAKVSLKEIENIRNQVDKVDAVKRQATTPQAEAKYTTLPSLNSISKKDITKQNTAPIGTTVMPMGSVQNNASLSNKGNNVVNITDSNAKKLLSKEDRKKRNDIRATSKEEQFGANNPLLATGASIVEAPFAGVEGGIRTLGTLITGNKDMAKSKFGNMQSQTREGVKQNISSDLGKGAYDIGTGVADMLANAAVGGATGGSAVAGALMGGKAGQEATESALNRGANARQAALYGTAVGGAEGYFNTKGLDVIKDSLAKSAGKNVLKNLAIGSGVEAAENALQETTSQFIDGLINGENSEHSIAFKNAKAMGMSDVDAMKNANKQILSQIASQGAMGALFGGAFTGAKMGAGAIKGKLPNIDSLKNGEKAPSNIADEQSVLDDITDRLIKENQSKIDEYYDDNKVDIYGNPIEDTTPLLTPEEIEALKNGMGIDEFADIEKINNLISDDNIGSTTITTTDNQKYVVFRSTRNDGNKWQLAHIDDTGQPVGHSMFKNDGDLIKELSNLQDAGRIKSVDGKEKGSLSLSEQNEVKIKDMLENPDEFSDAVFFRAVRSLDRNADVSDATKEDIVDYLKSFAEETADDIYDVGIKIYDGERSSDSLANDLINAHIDDPNSPYGRFDELHSDNGTVDTPSNTIPTPPKADVEDTITDMFGTRLDDLSQNVQFKNSADKAEFDGLAEDIRFAIEDIVNSESSSELVQNIVKLEQLSRRMNQTIAKGTIYDEPFDYKAEQRQYFKDLTKGTTIKLTDDLRSEVGLKDKKVPVLNRAIQNALGVEKGNIKFSTTTGFPIDEVITPELRTLIGSNEADTNADTIARLVDYVESLKKDNTPVAMSAEGMEAFSDDYWDNLADYRDNLANTFDDMTTVAEDTGIGDTTYDDSDTVASSTGYTRDMLDDIPEDNETAPSRVVTNTAVNSDITSRAEIANDPAMQEIARHSIQHESNTLLQAYDNFDNARDRFENDYITGAKPIDSAVDVDTAMLILNDTRQSMRDAKASGDMDTYNALNDTRMSLLEKLAKAGTEKGRFVQSFAKWNRTSDGALVNGTSLFDDRVNSWATRNEALSKKNAKLAEALKQQGNDGTIEAWKAENKMLPTREELRIQVENTLGDEYASILDQFSDSDIDYLTNLIDNHASVADLTDALNAKMATGRFGISAETQAKVNDIFDEISQYPIDSKERVEGEMEAFRLIGNEVMEGASFFEKYDAWRFMAMLGNPKTMIRNWIGNNLFGFVNGVSNNVAAMLEEGADASVKGVKSIANKVGGKDFDTSKGIDRTKAVLNRVADKDLIDMATKDSDNSMYRRLNGTKYKDTSMKNEIMRNRDTWDSKSMRKLEELVGKGLSDYSAVRRKYGTSLAGYMKANGLNEDAFKARDMYNDLKKQSANRLLTDMEKKNMQDWKNLADKMDKARDYAAKKAEYATFHEDNVIAQIITDASLKAKNSDTLGGKAMNMLIEGIMPFRKTPANILRSGIEYSPLGAIDSIAKTGKLVLDAKKADTYIKNGKEKTAIRANDVIDSWAKSLTGSSLVALGMYLADKGILISSDDDTQYQDQLEGKQNYSLKFSTNGKEKTATIDFLAPAVMPLLMGAEVMKVYNKNAGDSETLWNNIKAMGNDLEGLINSASSIAEPIVETSMLSGLNDSLSAAAQAVQNGSNIAGIGGAFMGNAVTSYATQGVPTLSGQIARAVDNTRRSTYSDKTGIARTIDRQKTKMLNKIPGLSMMNEEYVDTYGRTQKNSPTDNILGRAAYQLLSPSYIADVNETDADRSARDVYNETGNAKVFADLQTNPRIDGEKLSKSDYTKYARAYGEVDKEVRDTLANDDRFNGLSADSKAEILSSIDNFAKKVGESTVVDGYDSDNKAYGAYVEGGVEGVVDYFINDSIRKAEDNVLKEEGIKPTDFTRTLNDAQKDRYKSAMQVASKYGKESLSEHEYKIYNTYGAKRLDDELGAKAKADEYGVTVTDDFRKAYKSGEGAMQNYAKAYKAVTSVPVGKDEFGDTKYLSLNDTTKGIYQKEGLTGLKKYASASMRLDSLGMSTSDRNIDFAKTHGDKDLRVLQKVEKSGDGLKERIPALERSGASLDLAYDIIMKETGGNTAKKAGTSKQSVVNYYYNKY